MGSYPWNSVGPSLAMISQGLTGLPCRPSFQMQCVAREEMISTPHRLGFEKSDHCLASMVRYLCSKGDGTVGKFRKLGGR